MGSLAGCLDRHGISGLEADSIRKAATDYRVNKNYLAAEANEQAAIDALATAKATHKGLLTALRNILSEEQRKAVFASKKEGAIPLEKFIVKAVTPEEYAKADSDPSYNPEEKTIGMIEARSESEANKLLLEKIKTGEYPKGAELSVETPAPAVAEKAEKEKPSELPFVRVQIEGQGPAAHKVVREIEANATEKELGERYFEIENERTGERQTLEMRDLKGIREKADIVAESLEKLSKIGKDQKGAAPVIMDIAETIYDAGMTFNTFVVRMKTSLGELFNRFKSLMIKAYQGIKAKLKEERGSFSTKDIEEATPFYSSLERILDEKVQTNKPVDPDMFFSQLKNAKADEVSNTNIKEFLEGKKSTGQKVSKSDVMDYLKEQRTELKDVVLGGQGPIPTAELGRLERLSNSPEFSNLPIEERQRINRKIAEGNKRIPETQFSTHQEPGGTNYREMFVTAEVTPPEDIIAVRKTIFARYDAEIISKIERDRLIEGTDKYVGWQDGHSQYSDIQNPIIRIRFNERTDNQGRKILFIEEMQGPSKENQAKMPEWLRKRQYDIGVKRILKYAADNGFDGISWASGEMQVNRYDLSKRVESIGYQKRGEHYNITVWDKDGKQVWQNQSASKEDVENNVGKEILQKMEDGIGEQGNEGIKFLQGLDLKVGGEGLKSLYDKILPKKFEEITKGKVGETRITRRPITKEQYEKSVAHYGEETLIKKSQIFKAPFILVPKTAGGGFALYSKGKQRAIQGVLPKETVEARLAELLSGWKNAPSYKVVKTINDIDEKFRKIEDIESAKGIFDPKTGKITYISDHFADMDDLERTMLHETVHWATEGPLAGEIRPILRKLWLVKNKEVRAKAEQNKFDITTWEGRDSASKEVLTDMAKDNPNHSLVLRIVTAIRAFIRKMGIKLEVTDSDIKGIIAKSLRIAREGIPGGIISFESEQPLFSRAENEGEKGLTEEQKAQADKDIMEAEQDIISPFLLKNKGGYWKDFRLNAKKEKESVKLKLDEFLGIMSTRLFNIAPELKFFTRRYIYDSNMHISRDSARAHGFIKKYQKLPRAAKESLNMALLNSDVATSERIAEKYNMKAEVEEVRKIYTEIRGRALAAGLTLGKIENYWARRVKDVPGYMGALQGTKEWSAIEKEIDKIEHEKGQSLSDSEKASVINSMLRGALGEKILLTGTSHAKTRKLATIPAEFIHFYMPADQSLVTYITTMNHSIEAARFFGKKNLAEANPEAVTDKDVGKSIGSYIVNLKKQGKTLTHQDEESLRKMLQALFRPTAASSGVQLYKNFIYLQTLGQITSPLTQLMDIALVAESAGYWNTLKVLGKVTIGKSSVTLDDIGIDLHKMQEEFDLGKGLTKKALDNVLDLLQFTRIDKIGKEALLSAKFNQFKEQAKRKDLKLSMYLKQIFGEKEAAQVLADLLKGTKTDDTMFLLFNELSDMQPISSLEVPEMYLKSNIGKTFYALKTYQLKLLDIYRNDVWYEIKNGNKLEGFKKLARLTTALIALGWGTDAIKDFLLGRKTDPGDRVMDNLLRIFGLSKYTLWQTRVGGLSEGLKAQFAPPLGILDTAVKDIDEFVRKGELEKGSRAVASIPIFGKPYYWWFGRGSVVEGERQEQRSKEEQVKSVIGEGRYEANKELQRLQRRRLKALSSRELSPQERESINKKYRSKIERIRRP